MRSSLHCWVFSAEIFIGEGGKKTNLRVFVSPKSPGNRKLSHQTTRYEWFSPVNIVCGFYSLQAGSTVCGEPPPLGVGDGKLRRQRHHGGAPEQRPSCGVVGQTQVSTSCVRNNFRAWYSDHITTELFSSSLATWNLWCLLWSSLSITWLTD